MKEAGRVREKGGIIESHSSGTKKIVMTIKLRNDLIRVCSCCSIAKLCPILCYLMDCGIPDCSVLQYLPEFAQTHVQYLIITFQISKCSVCAQSLSCVHLFATHGKL